MKNKSTCGKFVVSLDFELMWGVRDVASIETYGENIRGVHQVIPKLLSLFNEYGVHGTFATVGLLFFDNKKELLENLPYIKPKYEKSTLSPYDDYLKTQLGGDYQSDPYHFGWPLIQQIKKTPGQEIGTHTFCHYYCLESGQTEEDFRADLKAAILVANKNGISISSIIFPRNQLNVSYLEICREAGIIAYRGNERSWIYSARSGERESLLRRALRLIDAYINISGHHCYSDEFMVKSFPINIPSSRFLRPFSFQLRILDKLRLRRIKKSMTYAARKKLLYHLWWHPHNFGVNQKENFVFLIKILQHYHLLKQKYSFESYTMSELAKQIIEKRTNGR